MSIASPICQVRVAGEPRPRGSAGLGGGRRAHVSDAGSILSGMPREVSLDHVEWSPSTDDEVPITLDGRRLDSKEKILEFLAELQAQRAAEDFIDVD
jgi:hypothetical protein